MGSWVAKANLRGPAGYNATGAAEDDAAVAAFVAEASGATATGAAVATKFGAVIPPDATNFTQLQAAATAATAAGARLVAAGSITTNQTLIIECDADLGELTYHYTGSGVAVQLGSTTADTFRLRVALPKIIAANKTVPGWSEVAGTTGVKAVNLNSCSEIVVPYISNFETGLLVYGQGHGNAYNTFLIGHLDNNKVNLKCDANSTGWSNQNTYIGGRYGHNSAEGTNQSGTRHILMVAGLTNPINNNTWLNPSVESDTAQYHVDFAGTANMIINGRWEAAPPRVRFQAAATGNQILYGYSADQITFTHVATSTSNHVFTSATWLRGGGGPVVLDNTSSSASAADVVMAAGAIAAGSSPTTAYAVFRSALKTGMKRAADAYDRLRLDHNDGRVYFGDGTADPTMFIGNAAGILRLDGMTVGTTAPSAGGGGALPATPAGYMSVYLNGATRKIPYY